VYLLRSREGNRYTEIGKVSLDFVKDELKLDIVPDGDKLTIIYTNNKGAELMPMTPWTMAHRLGHAMARTHASMRGKHSSTTHFFEQLRGSVSKLLKEILTVAYGTNLRGSSNDTKITKELCYALGTFKSARDRNIRNDFEFMLELFAQCIITGKVTLNSNLPTILPIRSNWGNKSGLNIKTMTPELKEEIEDIIYNYQNTIYYDIDALLGASIGDIFVM